MTAIAIAARVEAFVRGVVANLFRLAAIFHGIKGRLVRGNASSAHAEKMVTALPVIAQRAWEQALRAHP
jgi:hypothetical protein